jgi:hypothetical protein
MVRFFPFLFSFFRSQRFSFQLYNSTSQINHLRFTHRIAPWVHYIPIQIDYSDLYDALIFFRGDLSGHGAHEDLANKIAGRAREWSLKFWRKEDMVAYLYR